MRSILAILGFSAGSFFAPPPPPPLLRGELERLLELDLLLELELLRPLALQSRRRRENGFALVFKAGSYRECPFTPDDSPHHVADVHMPSPRYLPRHAVQWLGGQTLPPSPNAA